MSKIKNYTILLAFLMSICLVNESCEKDNQRVSNEESNSNVRVGLRATTEFCMMTYNTFLIDAPDIASTPEVWGGSSPPKCEGQDCLERAYDICRYITESNIQQPDIVTFQESLNRKPVLF